MKIDFHPEAEIELDDAVKWYNNESAGLGITFAKVVDETVLRLVRYPKYGSETSDGLFRALTKRFPYGIYYSIVDGSIMIYAIGHLHRKPGYWKYRIG